MHAQEPAASAVAFVSTWEYFQKYLLFIFLFFLLLTLRLFKIPQYEFNPVKVG